MKLCFIGLDLYTYGGIQRVVTDIINSIAGHHEIIIIMPYNQSDENIFHLTNRVTIKNYNDFTQYSKKNAIGVIAKAAWKINKMTGIFNHKFLTRQAAWSLFPEKQIREMCDYIGKNRFDIVIGLGGYYSLLLGLIASRIKIRAIGWQHSTYDSYFKLKNKSLFGYEYACKEYMANLDQLIAIADIDRDIFQREIGLKTQTLYNPVAIAKEPANIGEAGETIVFVGRLVEYHKGTDLLAKIMREIVRCKPRAKLIVVGDGPDRGKFESYVKAYGIGENVVLTGMSNHVDEYLSKAAVFVHTSWFEGFGVVIIEAMSRGLPVVAFHNNGPSEIITHNTDGFLIQKYDVEAFAKTVIMLLDDAGLRGRIGEAAVKRAAYFSLENVSERFEKILNEFYEQSK